MRTHFSFVSEDVALIQWRHADGYSRQTRNINVFLGCCTATQTASLGPYLGDLTDEIGGGDYITEICSGGPKTYGYRTASGKTCMKAKGITLNAKNSKLIKLDTLIDLVDHHLADRDNTRYILACTDNIVRDKKRMTLKNTSVVKRFKVMYNKRVLRSDFTTLPYGYRYGSIPGLRDITHFDFRIQHHFFLCNTRTFKFVKNIFC